MFKLVSRRNLQNIGLNGIISLQNRVNLLTKFFLENFEGSSLKNYFSNE